MVYLVVVAAVVAGLVTAAVGAWRTGIFVMGLAFAFALVMRAILPDERAGMLRVRRKLVDLVTLFVTSGLLLVLALVVPHRR